MSGLGPEYGVKVSMTGEGLLIYIPALFLGFLLKVFPSGSLLLNEFKEIKFVLYVVSMKKPQ